MKSAMIIATLFSFTLGAATAMAHFLERKDKQEQPVVRPIDNGDSDSHSHRAKELVLVLDSELEFRPDREGCAFVIGAPVRKANDNNVYEVEFCSRSTVSIPEGCEATTCMDVDEFQIVVSDWKSSMSAEVIDVAGVPSVETLGLIDEAIANLAGGNPIAVAGWQGRGIFTWATMLGTVADATGKFKKFDGGEAQYEGGLEWVGVIRGRGTLRFIAPENK